MPVSGEIRYSGAQMVNDPANSAADEIGNNVTQPLNAPLGGRLRVASQRLTPIEIC